VTTKTGVLIAALSIAVGLEGGCAGQHASPDAAGKGPVIGVSLLNLSNEFIVMLNQAMEDKARQLGVRLIVNDAQRSADRQVQQVESFVAQKVDAIVLNPCEVEASAPAVDKALTAGIPVVNVNSETKSAPSAFVGSRDEDSGRIAMEYIAKRLSGHGNVLMIHGYMGQAAQIERSQGALEVMARTPGLKLLAQQTADWDRAKAMSLMENWIQSYGDRINAVFAQNDEMALGALMALEQAKRKANVVLVGVDAIGDALAAVRDGRLDATIFQDAKAQGETAIEIAVKILRREPYQKQTLIPFQLVTEENVGQYLR
jgi:inositol transport system substrate-binding protein